VSDRREGDEMATARFQVVALVRSARVSASGQPDPGTRSRMHQSWAGAREFTGQFMSANNRSVARSAGCLPGYRVLPCGDRPVPSRRSRRRGRDLTK
jgi:hypothetical protein